MAEQAASNDQIADRAQPLAIDVRRLQPMEIVIARRYVHQMPLDGFPGLAAWLTSLTNNLRICPKSICPSRVRCMAHSRRARIPSIGSMSGLC